MMSIFRSPRTLASIAAGTLALGCLSTQASELPGKGVKVYPSRVQLPRKLSRPSWS